jgi:phenylalanyl-tRNA synthetase beta chain
MLCSASELGVSKDHSGILVLPPDSELGGDVVKLLQLDDTIFELEITPNRPDCMSLIGVAREVAALTGNDLKVPETGLTTAQAECPATVDVMDPGGCPRFLLRYIEGVKIGPSPSWMATRLLQAGVRPISNVVDVTNYVMLETGQPMHAYDADLITDQAFIVRRAQAGERVKTLDGVERSLDQRDLLISDPKRPLGLAGVMGGEDSEVTARTSRVILEAAAFEKTTISYTSRRHGLRTEASARFERGSDAEGIPFAAARAARFIAETSGGKVAERTPDAYLGPVERPVVTLRPGRTSRMLGLKISPEEQIARLRSIGLSVTERTERFEVEIPSFRPDLTREADLVEEVARLVGFEKLPTTLPPGRAGGLDERGTLERRLRRSLVGLGMHEVWTSSFIGKEALEKLDLSLDHPARTTVDLENPMVENESALRTTLMPALLDACAYNMARRAAGASLFEIARVYEPTRETLPREASVLCAVFSGERSAGGWRGDPEMWDFFSAKGVIEAAMMGLGAPRPATQTVNGMPFHPTRGAALTIGDQVAGVLGEVHPDVCARFDVPEGTILCEVALSTVLSNLGSKKIVEEVPRFPANYIDLAVVVDERVAAARIEELIRKAGAPQVTSVQIFDLYVGEQIPNGKKSLAYALELRVPDRTLTDEEAAKVRDRIVLVLRERAQAELRA